MNVKLYIYDHCPFCVKARMIFGLKNLPFELKILLNDDEVTPVRMIGQKMLPILERDGEFMGESMDIVATIDQMTTPILTGIPRPKIAAWIRETSSLLYRHAIPRFGAAPFDEFQTTSSRAYFIRNKEKSVGSFGEIFAEGASAVEPLNAALAHLATLIVTPSAVNGMLSTDDIHLFAHLHSFSIIRGLIYPEPVEAYRQTLADLCKVPLLDDLSA